jgi:MFS family permease
MNNEYNGNILKFYLFSIFGGFELTVSIFALFFLSNHLSMIQVMTLEAIFIITILFLEIPSGVFADMFGRKTSLVLSSIFLILSFITFGLGSTFWIFLIAQILMSFCWALKSGADSAFIYDSLKELRKEDQYESVFGKVSFIWMFSLTIISIVSAYLASIIGFRALFFISVAFYLIALLISLTFKEPPIHKHLQEKSYFKHLKKAIKFTISHKVVRNFIIYYGLFAAVTHLMYFVIQPYYEFSGLPRYILGITMASYFLFAGIGHLLAGKIMKIVSEKRLLISLLLISSLSFIVLFNINLIIAILFIAISSFASGVRDIFVEKEINIHTKSYHRATVISIKSISKSLMYAVFAPLIGLFVDIYSPNAAFLMMGIGLFIFLIYIILLFKLYDKSPAL